MLVLRRGHQNVLTKTTLVVVNDSAESGLAVWEKHGSNAQARAYGREGAVHQRNGPSVLRPN